jgi:hypothetical protein
MSDLIERQAAIEGLTGYIDNTGIFNQDKWFVHGIKTAITHLKSLPSVQPVDKDINVSCKDAVSRQAAIDAANKLVDRFEQILRDIRETNEDESVCGLCEYDGAFIGQSGDWCNECPGFDKADCFKLSDKCRKKWLKEFGLPATQPYTDEQIQKMQDLHQAEFEKAFELGREDAKPQWIPVSDRLPEDGTWNIFSDGKNISVERYKMDAIDHFFPQGRWFSFDKAIAWMPLPKPYQKEGEQE